MVLAERRILKSVGETVGGSSPKTVKPASRSMHESSLHCGDRWRVPEMKGAGLVEQALEGDTNSQVRKYGCTEPSGGSARFAVTLPQSPQHSKYCAKAPTTEGKPQPRPICLSSENDATRVPTSCSGADASPNSGNGFTRFNKQTLSKIFREIDYAGSGFVSHRQLILALQRLEMISSGESRREQTSRLKGILREIDTSGTGTVNWAGFLEFCVRGGFLLRYLDDTVEEELDTSFMNMFTADQEQAKKMSVASPVTSPTSKSAADIRTGVGKASEARYRRNRRAGSPMPDDEDGDDVANDEEFKHEIIRHTTGDELVSAYMKMNFME